MALHLQRLLARGYWEQAGEEGKGIGGAADDAGAADESDDNKSKGEGVDADDKKEGEGGTSDSEAKLLKEVMKRKGENKDLKEEVAKLTDNLSKFDGVDLELVSQLIADKKASDTKKLEDEGQWDALKTQMADENAKIVTGRDAKIGELEDALKAQSGIISKLTLGHSFDTSAFIGDDLNLSPGKARIIYGDHFDIDGDKTVAYDRPKGAPGRTPLVDASGDNLSFDAALRKIVDADPDKATMLKSKQKQGAGSGTNGGKAAAKSPVKLTGVGKIAAGLAE